MSTDPNPLPPDTQAILEPSLPTPPPARLPAENPPWTLWDIGAIALIMFGAMMVFGVVAAYFAMHWFQIPQAGLEHNPRLVVPIELSSYIVTLVFMVMLVRSRGLPFWRTVRWRWTGNVAGYVLLGVGLSFVVAITSALLPIPKQLPIEKYFADTAGTWILSVFGITVAPLMEELFFRGFLYPALARPLGVRWSVVITAFLFALIHSAQLASAWAPLLLLFIVGIVLTAVRVRTDSIVPGFFLHAAYNATLFIELFFQTDHFRHFDKISG